MHTEDELNETRFPPAAFTLTEMLVVISIVTLVFSIGFSFVSLSQDKYRLQATANSIVSSLRRARSEAMSTGVPVEVVLNKASERQGRLSFYRQDTIASWEFDRNREPQKKPDQKLVVLRGAFGKELTCRASVGAVPGPVGGAIQMKKTSRRTRDVSWRGNCMHNLDLFHPAAVGFTVEFSYWFREAGDDIGLVYQEEGIQIGLDKRQRMVAVVGGLSAVSTEPQTENRWADVRVTFRNGNGTESDRLSVHVNGTKVAEQEGRANLDGVSPSGSGTTGLPDRFVVGYFPEDQGVARLDQLRYSRIIVEELASIPKSLHLSGDNRFVFQSDGTTTPGKITLQRPDQDTIQLQVTNTGSIRQSTIKSTVSESPSSLSSGPE